MDEIDQLRRKIDDIDQDIVHLLSARFETAKLMGETKRARGLSLRDPQRERRILHNVTRLASKMGVDPGLVGATFRQIFRMSVRAQGHTPSPGARALAGLTVAIVGGTGGMGQFFARFAANHGGSAKIVGRSMTRTRKVAKRLGVVPTDLAGAGTSDIVMVAVPMEATADVCFRVSRHMREGSLLMDLSSVKSGITERVAEEAPSGVEYVSLHPLFGPDVDWIHGQNLVAVPYRSGVRWRKFSGALQTAGAKVHTATAEEHDKAMSYVQGLHHFALISLGLSLKGWDGSYSSHSLRETLERVRAMLYQWETVDGIQRLNPFVATARKRFSETVTQLTIGGVPSSTLRALLSNVQKWSRKQ